MNHGDLGGEVAKAAGCGFVDPSSNPVEAKFLSTRSNLFLNKPNVQSACLVITGTKMCEVSGVFLLEMIQLIWYLKCPKSVEFDFLGVDKVTQP